MFDRAQESLDPNPSFAENGIAAPPRGGDGSARGMSGYCAGAREDSIHGSLPVTSLVGRNMGRVQSIEQ